MSFFAKVNFDITRETTFYKQLLKFFKAFCAAVLWLQSVFVSFCPKEIGKIAACKTFVKLTHLAIKPFSKSIFKYLIICIRISADKVFKPLMSMLTSS